MKYIVLPLMGAALVFAMALPVRAEYFLVGDSISCWRDGYADILQDRGFRIRNYCQPGRRINGYVIPPDLRADPLYFSKALYVLGTNDILGREPIRRVEARFLQHIQALKAAGFQVTVIAPPMFEQQPKWSKRVRAILWRHRTRLGYRIIDLNRVWYNVTTLDGIHPDSNGHTVIAEFLQWNFGS